MSTNEPKSSPGPGKGDDRLAQENLENPTSRTDLPESLNDPASDSPSRANMNSNEKTDPFTSDESQGAPVTFSESAPSAHSSEPRPDSLAGQLDGLSISEKHAPEPEKDAQTSREIETPPPPPPDKNEISLQATSSTAHPSSQAGIVPGANKELPHVPDDSDAEKRQESDNDGCKENENDSQPEIQSIMGQFQDPSRTTDQQEIMSPRLGLAEQFRSSQGYFPPRRSSLENAQSPVTGSPSTGQHSNKPASSMVQPPYKTTGPEEPMLRRQSSASTLPPPPEPEPDQPFDFHRFLEQLRHRTADPVAKFLRSFLMEFGKKQWMVHEQVKIISDFLAFITNKMALCEVWRDVSDKVGHEPSILPNLLPAIPAPPTIPRSASRSRRKEIERMHGPWRRGQHQEDIERDEILAQKIRIYSWVKEEHLDIPPVSGGGRRFLNLAQQELLKINGYRAPRDKVICILNCCKVIFGLLKNTKKADTSADAFIPLLIYVVLHANPDHLPSNIQYILRFRNQDKLSGEAGYYLSSLSGAIQFIESLDRTSLTVSDEEFERNVEAAVSAIAEENRETEPIAEKPRAHPTPTSRPPQPQSGPSRREASQSSDDDSSAPVAGLLRTIQKPLSTIGRMFSEDSDAPPPQDRPLQPATTPQPAQTRLNPNVYQPPRSSSEGRHAQDAAARQASAEDAEARRIQRAEHNNVVETLSNMFPNLDRDVIDDVVKMKEGRVGLAVDACLALSAE
ncbi:hypothetical protein N7468_010372 [Penicillium chermesinum]|uniref:Guanine nucleotide exchange factor Vps9 n=1 Tax=Penicillium chermesinum TaxID=63820 RepID=A0A9W9NCP1_9EURO|nr:uncharacterized protein N7468_010372 [Penicillium chermesinum]KAJ5217364.1 hypothetical protein N7468_010372 [Penicillium chermesinum]